ncbi:MAG: SDR family oxidoreductase [Burkholderiaceae bacterium]|nr:MAG: SDR family oxidoreductase [Burkholderiaceae bacterium]
MSMDRVLVTGATGLLGTTLCPAFEDFGYTVIKHALNSEAHYQFDLSQTTATSQALDQVRPNIIINLVSLTSVELCEERPHSAYMANTKSVENLAAWIAESGEQCHLVQISTDHVYDGMGLHEENDITITNTYAFSKYAGELAATRVPSTILRTNFVGRSKDSRRESLTDWVYDSMTKKKTVEVLDDVFFSPLSMRTLVEMIRLVVDKKPNGIFNLGSHDGMTKAEFDFAFAECLGLPTGTMRPIPADKASFLKARRPKNMQMDSSKFEREFGIKLPRLVNELERVAEEYRDVF